MHRVTIARVDVLLFTSSGDITWGGYTWNSIQTYTP
jgi:hypothetical protein